MKQIDIPFCRKATVTDLCVHMREIVDSEKEDNKICRSWAHRNKMLLSHLIAAKLSALRIQGKISVENTSAWFTFRPDLLLTFDFSTIWIILFLFIFRGCLRSLANFFFVSVYDYSGMAGGSRVVLHVPQRRLLYINNFQHPRRS
jgi:hypothetical protein